MLPISTQWFGISDLNICNVIQTSPISGVMEYYRY